MDDNSPAKSPSARRAKQLPAGALATGVPLATLLFVVLGLLVPETLARTEGYLVLGLMLLFGLPHGATDHGLYAALGEPNLGRRPGMFYLLYGGVIALYGLVWLLLPLVAFGFFLLMSCYHFGQSNWVKYTGFLSGLRWRYLLWGAGVLLTPVLLHAGEAAAIVGRMTNTTIGGPGRGISWWIIGGLAGANAGAMVWARWRGELSSRALFHELLVYTLLMALFLTNSLLLGFTVYFVLWHSLDSAWDQWRFFRGRLGRRERRRLGWEIGLTVFGALVFCLYVWLGPGPDAALRPGIIGGVFIFISLLTLPHMLLIDRLYDHWSPRPTPSS